MPSYVYKAKKGLSETVIGHVDARDQDEAIELINQMGLLPIFVEQQNSSATKVRGFYRKRVTIKELYRFSRQLVSLLKAGVSILRGLQIIAEQTPNGYFRQVIKDINLAIKNGKPFSECLLNYPNVFSTLYVAMVHAGEESGNLQEMLGSVAEYLKSQDEMYSKVRVALAYPILMLTVGMGTIFFILTFVMPKITRLFADLKDLPMPTQILLNISDVMRSGWVVMLCSVFGIIIFAQMFFKTPQGRVLVSGFRLKAPFLGDFVLRVELARFCRTLSLLLNSGVPILRAIQIAVPILDNEILKKKFMRCQKDLAAGGTLGNSLLQFSIIPPMMSSLVGVGEESGSLSDSLSEIADAYEQETDELIKVMTTLMEPVLILTVGAVVGFIVFSMLLPIFQVDFFVR